MLGNGRKREEMWQSGGIRICGGVGVYVGISLGWKWENKDKRPVIVKVVQAIYVVLKKSITAVKTRKKVKTCLYQV